MSIEKVYQDLQQGRIEHPGTVRLAYRNRGGSLITREVPLEDLHMRSDLGISPVVMDLVFELSLLHGPRRVSSSPPLTTSREEACVWACLNPPPADSQGLVLTPVFDDGCWSMIIEDYGGPESDRYGTASSFQRHANVLLAQVHHLLGLQGYRSRRWCHSYIHRPLGAAAINDTPPTGMSLNQVAGSNSHFSAGAVELIS